MKTSSPIPMKKQIQISIPKPCHEKWSSFTKTSNGGFCSSCQKEVIDFTSWSDEQIKLYFKNISRNTCGRFRKDQLTVYTYDKRAKAVLTWLSFAFTGILILFASRSASGQNNPRQTTEQYQPDDYNNQSIPQTRASSFKVSGIVRSVEENIPLPGVNVVLKGTSTSTNTDADGRFTLTSPTAESPAVIVFTFIGLETVERSVSMEQIDQEMVVDMKYDQVALLGEMIVGGGVSCRWYAPRGLWSRVKRIFGL